MNFDEVIKKRRSIRQYQPKPIEPEKVEAILKAAMMSPSARHERLWEFVVVDDPTKIKQLAAVKPHAQHVGQAPVVIVVCSGPGDYWLEDASIVGQTIYLAATNEGLGTCWTQIRGGKDPAGDCAEAFVRRILNIPDEIRVLCLMPLGYPALQPEEHSETDFEEEKIHRNQW